MLCLSRKYSCFINTHSATTRFFSSSHCFPVAVVKDFPSLVLFFVHTSPLPLSLPPLPLSQGHCVHMAPACDMKLSQNTPDTRFSPPLFQTLLHFKQNERKGKKGGRRRKKKWTRGTRRMCINITISFIHSFVLSLCIIWGEWPFNSCSLSPPVLCLCESLPLGSELAW